MIHTPGRRSRLRSPRALVPLALATTLAVGIGMGWPLFSDDTGRATSSAGADAAETEVDDVTISLDVDTSLTGSDAVTTLRATPTLSDRSLSSLEGVARRYDMTADELASKLEHDSTLQVSADGMLLYADTFDPSDIHGGGDDHAAEPAPEPTPTTGDDVAPEGEAQSGPAAFSSSGTSATTASSEIAPLRDTFKLHSRPGSKKTIYLDVDGHEFTAANGWAGHTGHFFRGWDPAGDGSDVFSPSERRSIQQLWRDVAQNFAAFDVDVTTEEPSYDQLVRTSATDQVYGHRAVISSHAEIISAFTAGYNGNIDPGRGNSAPASGTVGYSFVNVVGGYGDYVSLNSGGASNLQWVVTHEVGHALGLKHTMDRVGYPGVGTFTNFMDYATMNHQVFDSPDRAEITKTVSGAPRVSYAPDALDWRSAVARGLDPEALSPDAPLALELPADGRVEASLSGHGEGAVPNGDTDTYRLEGCTHLTARATVSHPRNRSMDLALDLSTHPRSVPGDAEHLLTRAEAGSLGGASSAVLTADLDPREVRYLTVRASNGTGLDDAPSRDVRTQHGDGASSGDYVLDVSGCAGTPAFPSPTDLRGHTTAAGTTTVAWRNDPTLHTEVSIDGRRTVVLAPGVTQHTVSTTPDVAVNYRIRAVDPEHPDEAPSRWASGRTTLPLAEPLEVSVDSYGDVRIRLHPDRPATHARLHVGNTLTAPQRGLYYAVSLNTAASSYGTEVTSTYDSLYFPRGRSDYIVFYSPENPDGYAVPYTVAAPSTARLNPTTPTAPTEVTWTRHDDTGTGTGTGNRASHTVTWQPPADDGGTEVFEYVVRVGTEEVRFEGTARSHTFHGLPVGSTGTVSAVNAAGESPGAALTAAVEAPLPLAPPSEMELREDTQGSHLRWAVPEQVGDRNVTGWRLTIGSRTTTLPSSQHGLNLTGFRGERATRVSLSLLGPGGVASAPRTLTLAPATD